MNTYINSKKKKLNTVGALCCRPLLLYLNRLINHENKYNKHSLTHSLALRACRSITELTCRSWLKKAKSMSYVNPRLPSGLEWHVFPGVVAEGSGTWNFNVTAFGWLSILEK